MVLSRIVVTYSHLLQLIKLFMNSVSKRTSSVVLYTRGYKPVRYLETREVINLSDN
jgi:hypothetical protein